MATPANTQPAEEETSPAIVAGKPALCSRRQDPLRRFTPTPHASNLLVMGHTIRLESNSVAIIERAKSFFARHQAQKSSGPDFVWRIIAQPGLAQHQTGVELEAFSEPGLRYANMGQRSFFAVDLRVREAVAYLDEDAVEAEPTLHCRPPFDTLFCMCAASLGKTALEAACVAHGDIGILIFGPPNSGKTTTSYLAAKLGLDFQADQATFVEMDAGEPRVWGDLLPAIFRPETLQFLPELRVLTREFCHPNFTVHYLPKQPLQSAEARPILPVASVFLKRTGSEIPAMRFVDRGDCMRRLREALLYQEDPDFEAQTETMIESLARLPSYEVIFADPKIAAVRVRELLLEVNHD